ncbi:MAG: type II toxin-antitoxin system PemK/MazF family toxin [Candidatus Lokiarchaeota archaeon]|nr:type II toxin-antitoxin system PemK/MazF family toxin [Candidatus Lokiarchaeota archaeon]
MGGFIKGDIVVVPFPFSDLTGRKRRPALVIKNLKGNNLILCQITAHGRDIYSIILKKQDYEEGSLRKSSYIQPDMIFTMDINIIAYKAARIKKSKMQEVLNKLFEIIS